MDNLNSLQQAGSAPGGGQPSPEDEAKRKQEEEMRRGLLATILDTEARERLSRIALVSAERSRQIEAILLRMAQSGQIRGRVTEAQLIDLLEQARSMLRKNYVLILTFDAQMEEAQGKTSAKQSKILYQRRKDFDDDFDI